MPIPLRAVAVAATLLLGLATAACSSAASGTSGTSGTSGAPGTSGGPTGAGTCDSACAYYLQCKSADGPENRKTCGDNCVAQGYTSAQLADFQKMDCANAVAAIENNPPPSSSSGGTSSGGAKDCFGCQHDGSSCIYIGPAGGYSQCDPSCC